MENKKLYVFILLMASIMSFELMASVVSFRLMASVDNHWLEKKERDLEMRLDRLKLRSTQGLHGCIDNSRSERLFKGQTEFAPDEALPEVLHVWFAQLKDTCDKSAERTARSNKQWMERNLEMRLDRLKLRSTRGLQQCIESQSACLPMDQIEFVLNTVLPEALRFWFEQSNHFCAKSSHKHGQDLLYSKYPESLAIQIRAKSGEELETLMRPYRSFVDVAYILVTTEILNKDLTEALKEAKAAKRQVARYETPWYAGIIF